MNLSTLSSRIKNQQIKLLHVIVLMVVLLGLFIYFISLEPKPLPKEKINDDAPVYDLTKAVDDKAYWMHKAENKLSDQEKKQDQLMNELEEMKKTLNESKEDEKDKSILSQLQQRVEELEKRLVETENHENYVPEVGNIPQNGIDTNENALQNISVYSERLDLTDAYGEKKTPHIDSYIPAGSYATAILLNGVDVSAGVSSQASPKPVLLKLIDKGSLPNKAVGKMKECRIVAAAYGELSSERAYMRLEKLSCTENDGHVIETDVDGYISGEDGKNGVRGNVVMRDTEMLQRGFIGGLLSGLGRATSQSFNTSSISPFGSVNTNTAKGMDVFKQAGSEGVGNAFDLMAKYNIQRAEQYQPVIQISAGRKVEVVFHSGSQFGEKRIRKISSNDEKNSVNFSGE